MTLPPRTAADSVADHLADHNTLHDRHNELTPGGVATEAIPVGRLGSGAASASTFLRGDGTWAGVSASGGAYLSADKVRFVSLNGVDTNSGLGPGVAFRTIGKALLDLEDANGIPKGTVYIGHGAFTSETFPMQVGNDLHIIGSGTGYGGTNQSGTQIQLPSGANSNMFEMHPLLASAWLHNFTLANLTLLGNKSLQAGTSYGLYTKNGGLHFRVLNVHFRQFLTAGWRHEENALNVVARDLLFEQNVKGASFVRSAGSGWTVDFDGNIQIDNNEDVGMEFIDSSASPPYDIAQVRFGAVKSEANIYADGHNPVLYFQSSHANAKGFNVLIHSLNATRPDGFDPPVGRNLVYQAAGSGRASRITIHQAACRGWNKIYQDDALSLSVTGDVIGTHQLEAHDITPRNINSIKDV